LEFTEPDSDNTDETDDSGKISIQARRGRLALVPPPDFENLITAFSHFGASNEIRYLRKYEKVSARNSQEPRLMFAI
jgi:hypothetical protein